MKIQSLLLAFLFFTIFSCDKKETDPEPGPGKQNIPEVQPKKLKKMVVLDPDFDDLTYNFIYEDDLISEIQCQEGSSSYNSKFTFDEDNKLQQVEFTNRRITKAIFSYEGNKMTQTFVPKFDSIIFTLDQAGQIINEKNYSYSTYDDTYEFDYECAYEWKDSNMVKSTFTRDSENYTATETKTYDDNPNPLYFVQGFATENMWVFGDLYYLIGSKNNLLTSQYQDNVDYSNDSECTYTYEEEYPKTMKKEGETKNGIDGDESYSVSVTYEYY